MLRDYPFTLNPELFMPVLTQFDMEHPGKDAEIALLEFRFITPDSFMWKFLINNVVYYLYAEDHIENLSVVYESIKRLSKDSSEMDFVKVKKPKEFEDTGPVKSATVYKRPDDYDEMKLYAADAGYDFAFLAISKEDPSYAYFNELAS